METKACPVKVSLKYVATGACSRLKVILLVDHSYIGEVLIQV